MADTIAEFQQLRSSLVERGRLLCHMLTSLKIECALRIEAATPIFLPQDFDRTQPIVEEFLEAHRQYQLFLDRHEIGRWDRSFDAGLIEDEICGKPADESAIERIVHAIQAVEKNRPPEKPTLDDIKGALKQCLDGLPESDGPIETIAFRLGADTLAWAHRSLDKLRMYDRPLLPPNVRKDRDDLDPDAVRQAIITLLAWCTTANAKPTATNARSKRRKPGAPRKDREYLELALLWLSFEGTTTKISFCEARHISTDTLDRAIERSADTAEFKTALAEREKAAEKI